MAVTSQIRAKAGFGEAVIEDWHSAGLLKPSAIKPIVFTAEKTIVRKTLGQLSDNNQDSLRAVIESVIG
ncbi:MAG TPA: toxin-antitoxin system, toxin component, MazF family protein [Armatimonadetes bacterium]|nr:toxin-antitoxin system, toxin component, MazF family protein [Armatimonadota bacterium]